MPSWGDLLGKGSVAETLLVWGVLNQLIGNLLDPAFTELRQQLYSKFPVVELSPADLADMVVKGIIPDEATAAAGAAKWGIDSARFRDLVLDTGEPPGIEAVLEMWRREIIVEQGGPGTASVDWAIRSSRLRNEWADAIKASRWVPLPPSEAVDAALRNQLDTAEAQKVAGFSGLAPEAFTVMLNSRGNPPSLTELLELARRQIIPWGNLNPATRTASPGEISFAQGIFEGDSKDKWLPYYAALGEYHPPPRTIVAMLRAHALDVATATKLLTQAGLAPELAAAYVAEAKTTRATSTKGLTQSNITALYESKSLDRATALAHLGALGVDPADAGLILDLADLSRETKAVNSAVSKVQALYVGHKVTRAAATAMLTALAITGDHAAHLLATWDAEVGLNVRQLTPAQIVDAWEYKVLDQSEATAELVALGYTPRDAWVLLSIKAKAPLPGEPAQGPAGPGVIP